MNNEVYIIAGGSSLKRFDFSKLKGKRTIAINKTIFNMEYSQFFMTMDHSLFNKVERQEILNRCDIPIFVVNLEEKYGIKKINGKYKNTNNNSYYNLDGFLEIIESKKERIISLDYPNFCHGKNSAFCAFQFAVLCNYNPIYLLGFDFTCEDNKTHFHSGYGENVASFQKKLDEYYLNFLNAINCLKIARPNLKIYNCSKISRLKPFLGYKEI